MSGTNDTGTGPATSPEPWPLAAAGAADLDVLGRLLAQLGVAVCLYDAEDRLVLWNQAYLELFPEQTDTLRPGTTYAQALHHFFASNLDEHEQPLIARHVAAGVSRHRVQQVPFIFQRKNGRWLKVASLPLPAGGRIRAWRDVTDEQAGAGRSSSARALASLDVGYAVFDAGARFVSANKRYQELFPGIGDLVRVGATYREHLERIAQEVLHPDDAATLLRAAGRDAPRAEPVSLPVLLRRADGSWLQLQERLGEDGTIVATWTDATRQAEAEAEIGRLQAHLSDAVEAIPHGLMLFERDGRLALANRRLASIDPALSEQMHEGATVADFAAWRAGRSPQHDPRTETEWLRAATEPEESEQPDGRWLRTAPFRTSDGDLLVLLTDVTRERLAEREIEHQRDAAHQNEKLAALGSLLAGVAHELNNPLSVVVGRAALLEEAVADPRLAASIQALRAAADRCARIVRTFLSVARQKPRERRPVNVEHQIDAVCEMLAYGLRTADIQVERRYGAPDPVVEAEEDALHQVFTNLLVNAQHALEGAPRPRRLEVETRAWDAPGAGVEIAIADNGPGVSPALRARVFDPFFTTKPQGAGTGIGLSVCHGIVTGHGGTIGVDERPGGGARFTVRLPLGDVARAAPTPAIAGEVPATRARVLVVDDEEEIAHMLAEVLTRDGYDVATAADGEAALRALASRGYDLLITDLRMPGLDGRELLATVGTLDPTRRPALLVLTGDTLGVRSVRLEVEPPPAILDKPVDPDQLRRTVRELLGPGATRG